MGAYSEYLSMQLSFDDLCNERKKQLAKIAEIRKREIVVYASDISESNAPISIDYSDIVPFSDQLSMVKGNEIDIILETPGGIGEVVKI